MASLLAAATMLGTCVVAGAASTKNYDVSVSGKQMTFSRNGRKATYNMKTTDVKLVIDEDDDLLVCFTDGKSKYKGISLGSQRSINMGGTMNSLTLNSTLGSKISVNVTSDADIRTMNISSKNSVSIAGDVTTLTVNGAAQVSVEKGADIDHAKINSSTATLDAKSGAKVRKVTAAKRSNVTGVSGTTTSSKSDDDDDDESDTRITKLDISTMYVNTNDYKGDIYLFDIEDELENYVEAYYRRNSRNYSIDGEFTFTRDTKKIWDEDDDTEEKTVSASFRFKPDSNKYSSVNDTIKIRIGKGVKGSSSGSGTAVKTTATKFKISTMYINAGEYGGDIYLDDIENKIKNCVEAYYRENGRDRTISGTYTFKNSSKKIWDEDEDEDKTVSATFSFKPDSSKYSTESDTIKISISTGNSSSGKGSITPKFRIDNMEVDVSDYGDDIRLRDLEDDLEDFIEAYYREDGYEYEISGTYTFSNGTKKIWDEDDDDRSKEVTATFNFKPKNSKYKEATDTIRIYLEY